MQDRIPVTFYLSTQDARDLGFRWRKEGYPSQSALLRALVGAKPMRPGRPTTLRASALQMALSVFKDLLTRFGTREAMPPDVRLEHHVAEKKLWKAGYMDKTTLLPIDGWVPMLKTDASPAQALPEEALARLEPWERALELEARGIVPPAPTETKPETKPVPKKKLCKSAV